MATVNDKLNIQLTPVQCILVNAVLAMMVADKDYNIPTPHKILLLEVSQELENVADPWLKANPDLLGEVNAKVKIKRDIEPDFIREVDAETAKRIIDELFGDGSSDRAIGILQQRRGFGLNALPVEEKKRPI